MTSPTRVPCVVCNGVVEYPRHKSGAYRTTCSPECHRQSWSARTPSGVAPSCSVCGKPCSYMQDRHGRRYRTTCSDECKLKRMRIGSAQAHAYRARQNSRQCIICAAPLAGKRSDRITCSRACGNARRQQTNLAARERIEATRLARQAMGTDDAPALGTACLTCADLPWRRNEFGCKRCGKPYQDEPPAAQPGVRTCSPIAFAARWA